MAPPTQEETTPMPAPPAPPTPAAVAPARARGVARLLLAALRASIRHPGRSLAVVALLTAIGMGLGLASVQVWAAYQFRAARRDLERYHTAEAGDHFASCLRVWPNDPEVLLLASRAARRAGLFAEAEELLGRYQEVRGRDDNVVLERALLTAEHGEIDDVLKFCRAKVEANDPASPLILEALARGSLRAYPYRLGEADWAVRKWRERDPDNPMCLLLSGRVANERFAYTDAAAAFRRALGIDPEMDEARDRLSQLLIEINQPAEAVPHLEYLARRRPGDPMLIVRLARCQSLLGHPEEAAHLLDSLLRYAPNFPPALGERGKLALDSGDFPKAEELLRQAIARSPQDPTLLPLLQKCLFQSGQADKAEAMSPQIKAAKEDTERLSTLLSRELQANPRDANAQFEAGTLLLRLGGYDEGVRRLENATQIDPRHVKAHEALAEFYERIGETKKAAKHRRLAKEAAEPEKVADSPLK
jgi:tetratricopeptide (TPR) repeat protein